MSYRLYLCPSRYFRPVMVPLLAGWLAGWLSVGCTCTKGATRCANNAAQVCTNALEWRTITYCDAAQDFNGTPVPMKCQAVDVDDEDPATPDTTHACVPVR